MSTESRRAAVFAVSPDAAGIRGRFVRMSMRRYGLAPGIMRVLLHRSAYGHPREFLYNRVNFGARSVGPLQREMVATVVNGKIGGAP